MSTFVQGKSSKMPEVLEELGKHGFTGKDKFKAAQAICEDAVEVELLFSLDPSEVQDYVLSFL
ncbi:Minichromosome maintenance family protein [Perilla frutescens var. hirtella]|nr:Minichromosome maintenance family protein [Perilla frutescens var. hirtella]